MAQRAEPPQHGRDQRPRQRAVAIRQAGKPGIGVRRLRVVRRAGGVAAARRRRCRRRCAGRRGRADRLALGHSYVPVALAGRFWQSFWRTDLGRCFMAASIPIMAACSAALSAPSESHAMPTLAQTASARGAANRPPAKRPLTPAAERALAEAAARRAERDRHPARSPEGNRRPRRPRADALRRLGNQRPDVGFLEGPSDLTGFFAY